MAITINTPVIHKSYASVLSRIDPNALIFDNPNQQGTKLPAWFIVHREPVSSTCAIDGYQWLVYAIDIYYMVEYNKPRLFDEYAAIADQLDLELEYLPIYGTDTVVHVFDRSWELAMNALKYSTTLRLRVHPSVQREPYMQVIEDLRVFLKLQFEAILTFKNTTHPEFDAQIPSPISVTKGQSVSLPFVGGEFEDEDYKWTPSGWSIGAFGARVRLDESVSTDLLWSSTEKTATLSFENTTHPEFSVQMPESIIANKGTSVELPTVSGTFPVGSFDWNPSSWDIGSFGGSFVLNEDTTADLQWQSEEVFFDVSFANTSHPEFDVTLPQSEQVSRGSSVALPTVEGEFIQDNYKWTPDSWDIGAFGDFYTPNSDVVANLLWKSEEMHEPLPTVQITQAYFSSSGSAGATTAVYASNATLTVYDASGQTFPYDGILTYKAISAKGTFLNDPTIVDAPSTVVAYLYPRESTSHKLRFYSGVSSYGGFNIYLSEMKFATCTASDTETVKVYDTQDNEYNAFKYTADGTDYYYVLDGVQTDWTDDLSSIGYHFYVPSDEATGSISSLALPTAHNGQYTDVTFESLRYYAKGTLSGTGYTPQATIFGIYSASGWYYGTLTWTDESLGDLSNIIDVADPSSSNASYQTILRLHFIVNGSITGYHADDALGGNYGGQIAAYSYNAGVHSVTFYSPGTMWYSGTYSGRIMLRYIDGTTTFKNLSAFDLIGAQNGVLSIMTTTDRYDMYNTWAGDITIKAYYAESILLNAYFTQNGSAETNNSSFSYSQFPVTLYDESGNTISSASWQGSTVETDAPFSIVGFYDKQGNFISASSVFLLRGYYNAGNIMKLVNTSYTALQNVFRLVYEPV